MINIELIRKPEVVKLCDVVGVGRPVVDGAVVLPVPQLLQQVHVQVHLLQQQQISPIKGSTAHFLPPFFINEIFFSQILIFALTESQ